MAANENLSVIARRTREEIWNTANFALVEQDYAPDCVLHILDPVTPDLGRGLSAVKQLITFYRAAFPDARCTVEDLVADGDKVVVRWTARATNSASLMGRPATGRQVVVTGIDIYRFAGGKIQETWTNWDTAGLLQQLGLFHLP
jgi:steroid delta-isomerase-like uncharacterized protein